MSSIEDKELVTIKLTKLFKVGSISLIYFLLSHWSRVQRWVNDVNSWKPNWTNSVLLKVVSSVWLKINFVKMQDNPGGPILHQSE